jgi:ketoreductase RED2
MDLNEKVAIVTGSSSGIGEACARQLSAAGCRVVVNSRSSVEEGEGVAKSLDDAIYVQADIADPAGARRVVDAAADQWGRLDVLVNNAGTTAFIPHHDVDAVTPDVWHRILDVNVIGTWLVTQAALPHLRADGGGCIVNMGSVAGVRQTGSSLPYAVSKAAVHHMTELIAAMAGPEVRANAVAPGLIDTPWTRGGYPNEVFDLVAADTPAGRVGTPDDVAEVVLDVVRAGYLTGQVVLVDGGMALRR